VAYETRDLCDEVHARHRFAALATGTKPDRLRARNSCAIRADAATASSCSQTLITSQPERASAAACASSRSQLPSSFATQYAAFAPPGVEPCIGHRCQKQPCTNTATRARENTMSARMGRDPGTGMG